MASEINYRRIFDTVAVSIWDEDFSQVVAALDALRGQGVSDFRRYFEEHPEFVAQAAGLVRVRDVNRPTLELFEARDKAELLASLPRVFLPETLPVFRDELLAIAEGASSFKGSAPSQTLRGRRIDIMLNMVFPSDDPHLNSVLVSMLDVTEVKRAEEARHASEAQKGAVIELALDAVIVIDEQGGILEFNPSAERMFGLRRADVLGREMAELIIPVRDRDRHRRGLKRYLASGEQVVLGRRMEMTALRPDGSEFPIELAINATDVDGRPIFTGFLRDITERKAAEAALREGEQRLRTSEQRYRQVVNLIQEAIWIHREGTIVFANPSAARLFGADTADALIGRSIFSLLHPEDRARAMERTRAVATEGRAVPLIEMRLIGLDGRTRAGEFHAVPFEQEGSLYVLSAGRDVTAQREAEAQLRQAQKMEAIGNLTGGMAHDFNNLLGVIIGNLDLLRGRPRGGAVMDPETDQLSGEALDAALKGADLTQRLLAFARRQPLQPQRIDINELVESISKLVDRTLGEDIEIRLDLGADVWPAVADPAQLEASLVNIFNNARDAMPRGGVLTIATGNRNLDDDYTALHPGLAPGNYTMIEVSDTGTGIPPEALNHIFEPFFTTKEQSKGTGLGLSMVFGFMKQSGGHINVYSESGHGTTFRLYLPRATTAVEAVAARAAAFERGGHETILAVEDNVGLRRIVRRQLDALGYRVLEAEDGAAALKILESDAVDLLFTDIVMPGGLSGYDLARTVVARWPAMKVLLTSGFPEAKLDGNGGTPVNLRLLTKPYRKGDLARVLREILDAN